MFYVIGSKISNKSVLDDYILCHIYTMSRFEVSKEQLIKLVRGNKIQVKNVCINQQGDLVIKGWTYKFFKYGMKTSGEARYVLTHKIEGEHSYYVGINLLDDRLTWTPAEVANKNHENTIANATSQGNNYKFTDITKLYRDCEFEAHIQNEYNKYIAKSKLLGRNCRFKYEVLGKEVILNEYNGDSKDIILPPFITSINRDAFYLCHMNTVKLNEGLKYIGQGAFWGCGLTSIEIPSTVEVMSLKSLESNSKDLVNTEKTDFTKNVKFIGKKQNILII